MKLLILTTLVLIGCSMPNKYRELCPRNSNQDTNCIDSDTLVITKERN